MINLYARNYPNTKKSAALQVNLMEVAITLPTTTLKAAVSISKFHMNHQRQKG